MVRLNIIIIVIDVKNVLENSGIIFSMVVMVVIEMGCIWDIDVVIMVLNVLLLFFVCMFIFFINMILFLSIILIRFKLLSSVMNVKGVLISINLLIMLIVVSGIMFYIVNVWWSLLNSKMVIMNIFNILIGIFVNRVFCVFVDVLYLLFYLMW